MHTLSIAAALAPLQGEWYWHFSEQDPPVMEDRRLTIRDGKVFAAGKGGEELAVTDDGEMIRLKVGAESELRFKHEGAEVKPGYVNAHIWEADYAEDEDEANDVDRAPLDFDESYIGEMVVCDDRNHGEPIGMVPLEAAFLVRAEIARALLTNFSSALDSNPKLQGT
jgi:hypothetical protein